jgi:hypothetical protein
MKCKLLLLIFISQILYSQQRTCGATKFMENKMKDVTYARKHKLLQEKIYYRLQHPLSRRNNATLVIPVAVHFPESSPNNRACLEALAQTQVDILNKDYKGINSDISLWRAASLFYPGVNTGQFDITFEIATQNHPAISGIANGNKLVTIGYGFPGADTNDDADTNYQGYLNIVVRELTSLGEDAAPILGVSPLFGDPSLGQSVKVGLNSFSMGADCGNITPTYPFNEGRTLTHEVGHFFGLYHTFGDETDCSLNTDDDITDTPKIALPNYECPSNGSIDGCEVDEKALTMNYMDYTNDDCMYMFTQGQVDYSSAYLDFIASSFKQNTTLNTTTFTSSEFKVYPNPINSNVTIDFAELQNNLKVTISDLSGRTVFFNEYKSQTSSLNIDTISLQTGTYFMSIASEGKILKQKILVE